jgi:lambda family phage minor tail protein L
MTATADVQQLQPDALVDLFVFDTTELGGDVRRFHGYASPEVITWQGQPFQRFPIQASGFELTGDGRPPTPTLTIANVDGMIGALCRALDDLVGAKVTRLRTFRRYLDAVNFPGGNPEADPNEQLRPEVWYVEQRSRETRELIELALASPLDLGGQTLPGRQITANMCGWLKHGGYRGPYCGYTGTDYFTITDARTLDSVFDKCSGRLASCKLRFGDTAALPFGGFPAADSLRGY